MTTDRRRHALLCVTEPGGRNTQHVSPKMRSTEEACDDTSKSEAHNNNGNFLYNGNMWLIWANQSPPI